MKRPTKVMSVETYQQLISAMTILGSIFGLVAIGCGLLVWHYNIKKDQAANREVRWTDDHKNVAAFTFLFNDTNGKDLGSIWTEIYTITKTDSGNVRSGYVQNYRAKEDALYLPIGVYSYEIETADYETISTEIGISQDQIGQRWSTSLTLKPKNVAVPE